MSTSSAKLCQDKKLFHPIYAGTYSLMNCSNNNTNASPDESRTWGTSAAIKFLARGRFGARLVSSCSSDCILSAPSSSARGSSVALRGVPVLLLLGESPLVLLNAGNGLLDGGSDERSGDEATMMGKETADFVTRP